MDRKKRDQTLEAPSYFLRMTARSPILYIQLSANFSKILWPNGQRAVSSAKMRASGNGPYNVSDAQNEKMNKALSTLLWVKNSGYLCPNSDLERIILQAVLVVANAV